MLIIALGIVGGLILLSFFAIEIKNNLIDQKAKRLIRHYCNKHELEIVELNYLPGHYGLYFKKDGRVYYVSYSLDAGRIKWMKLDPLEVIDRRKSIQQRLDSRRGDARVGDNRRESRNLALAF